MAEWSLYRPATKRTPTLFIEWRGDPPKAVVELRRYKSKRWAVEMASRYPKREGVFAAKTFPPRRSR